MATNAWSNVTDPPVMSLPWLSLDTLKNSSHTASVTLSGTHPTKSGMRIIGEIIRMPSVAALAPAWLYEALGDDAVEDWPLAADGVEGPDVEECRLRLRRLPASLPLLLLLLVVLALLVPNPAESFWNSDIFWGVEGLLSPCRMGQDRFNI